MAALTPTGMGGTLTLMFSQGITIAMLVVLLGVLSHRTATNDLEELGGLAAVMPRYTGFFALGVLASIGSPGLAGFVGQALIWVGSFPAFPVITLLAVGSLAITAAYHLAALQKVHFGPLEKRWHRLAGGDMNRRETAILLPLALLVVVLGLYPQPLLAAVGATVKDLLAQVSLPG
jgi:NADH-quinone oxidoreductase subunit M